MGFCRASCVEAAVTGWNRVLPEARYSRLARGVVGGMVLVVLSEVEVGG